MSKSVCDQPAFSVRCHSGDAPPSPETGEGSIARSRHTHMRFWFEDTTPPPQSKLPFAADLSSRVSISINKRILSHSFLLSTNQWRGAWCVLFRVTGDYRVGVFRSLVGLLWSYGCKRSTDCRLQGRIPPSRVWPSPHAHQGLLASPVRSSRSRLPRELLLLLRELVNVPLCRASSALSLPPSSTHPTLTGSSPGPPTAGRPGRRPP